MHGRVPSRGGGGGAGEGEGVVTHEHRGLCRSAWLACMLACVLARLLACISAQAGRGMSSLPYPSRFQLRRLLVPCLRSYIRGRKTAQLSDRTLGCLWWVPPSILVTNHALPSTVLITNPHVGRQPSWKRSRTVSTSDRDFGFVLFFCVLSVCWGGLVRVLVRRGRPELS